MSRTLKEELKTFVEDMKLQEAGLIKKAGEKVMEMSENEIFGNKSNTLTNAFTGLTPYVKDQNVDEKVIFLHRLKSKLSIIQEYRSELENIILNCPEPQPIRGHSANYQPDSQTKANSTFERICSGGCGKKWKCKGECDDSYKIQNKHNCNCPECLKKYATNLSPNYRCVSRFPEPKPKAKTPQQKQARICSNCKTKFICNGECQDKEKIRFNDNCVCPKCAKKMPENIVEKFKCETRFPTNQASRNLIKKIAKKYAQPQIKKKVA